MKLTLVKSKIHGAKVTDANLNYSGSITVDRALMKAAGLCPYELVVIKNWSNAVHWETYVIPGKEGEITLNGPSARAFQPGDRVAILSTVQLDPSELKDFRHTVVHVDEKNQVTSVRTESIDS